MATIRLINTTKDHSKYASEEKKRAHSILLLIVTIGRLHCEFEVSGGGKVWLFYVIKGINSNHVGIISTYLISRPLLKFQTEIFIESKVFIWYLIWLINLMKQWIFEDFSKSYFISVNFSTNLMTQLKLNLKISINFYISLSNCDLKWLKSQKRLSKLLWKLLSQISLGYFLHKSTTSVVSNTVKIRIRN